MKTRVASVLAGLLVICGVVSVATVAQEEAKMTDLPAPSTEGGMPLMEALKARKSVRAFKPQALKAETLSNLLWAAFGVNRPDSGKRTAPSALNSRDIDVYVLTAEGAFMYDAVKHALIPVVDKDLRKVASRQAFTHEAPVHLVYVSDGSKLHERLRPNREVWSACHAGFIGQNVYLFCASEGLGSLFHASVDKEGLKAGLGLREDQEVVFAQVVGHMAE